MNPEKSPNARFDQTYTLIRIAGRKLDDGQRQWRVERQPCANPNDNRTGAGSGGRGNPSQTDARDDVKQQQIAKPQHPLGAVGIDGLGDGNAGPAQNAGFVRRSVFGP